MRNAYGNKTATNFVCYKTASLFGLAAPKRSNRFLPFYRAAPWRSKQTLKCTNFYSALSTAAQWLSKSAPERINFEIGFN